jgi:hypothetical protein
MLQTVLTMSPAAKAQRFLRLRVQMWGCGGTREERQWGSGLTVPADCGQECQCWYDARREMSLPSRTSSHTKPRNKEPHCYVGDVGADQPVTEFSVKAAHVVTDLF